MKRKRLRKWVVPTLISLFVITTFTIYKIAHINENLDKNNNYIINALVKNTKPVIEITDNKIMKPYIGETVNISKNYYSKDDEESTQQKSLIYYENIYIPNTGTLYSGDKTFDVVASIDGTIKNIKEDKIFGKTFELINDNIVIVYKSVDNITVKEGETVEKGRIIATSGNNKLSEEKDNCLEIEFYVNNKLVNPEKMYDKDVNEIINE